MRRSIAALLLLAAVAAASTSLRVLSTNTVAVGSNGPLIHLWEPSSAASTGGTWEGASVSLATLPVKKQRPGDIDE